MKFEIDQICNIKMMALDATMRIEPDEIAITPIKDTYDVGIGIVKSCFEDKEDDTKIYKMAVIEGKFDGHRNDLGELWVNEFESSEVIDG